MASQFAVNVYQINSQNPIPLNQVVKYGFPPASILIRAQETLLSTGVRTYGVIQVIQTGTLYLTKETQAVLVTAANA